MAIPKQIFQTFKTDKLSFWVRWHVRKIKRKNPEYAYHFYDDAMIEAFIRDEFPPEYIHAYQRLTIGAAKADFFRYAVLYKKGGIYIDIDSGVKTPFRNFIHEHDHGIISLEKDKICFVQWALIFEAGHPFLKKTLEMMLDHIENHRYPNDVHATTGPSVFTKAISACLAENPEIPYREMGVDYEGCLKFKYSFNGFFLYKNKAEHWKQQQKNQAIIK